MTPALSLTFPNLCRHGEPHTEGQYRRWMTEAGFGDITRSRLADGGGAALADSDFLIDKALSLVLTRSPRLEDAIEGKTVELIRDGVIRHDVLRQANFGPDELFEQLRMKDIEHVGQVRAAYLETNGNVSVFKAPDAPERPGLSIEPPWDVSPPARLKAGEDHAVAAACAHCGTVLTPQPGHSLPNCPRCHSTTWHWATGA